MVSFLIPERRAISLNSAEALASSPLAEVTMRFVGRSLGSDPDGTGS
jgi:hypothetical protein